jgi:polyhydroxyalkanoate synthesis regulator phasin
MSYLSNKRSRRNRLRKAANELHKELVKQGIMKPEPDGPFSSRLAPNSFAKEAEKERKRLEKQNRRALGKFFQRKGY